MRALLSEQCGPAESLVIRDIAPPVPGCGQVLISVEACGINYPDVLMIEDKYQFTFDRPFSPGIEVCGIVDSLGPDVSGPAPGTRIAAQVSNGGCAEKALVDASNLHLVPEGVAATTAASILLTYGTSYHALRDRARLKAGETLLVLGAGGGVGLAAVELGKLMGARVIAAVSSEEKAAAARSVGADEIVIYPTSIVDGKSLATQFKGACGGGADVVYDPVGGDLAEPALRTLGWDGRYLVVGFAAGIPKPPLNLVLLKGGSVIGVFWGAAMTRDPVMARATIAKLLDLLASGRIKPMPPRIYPLEGAADAIAALRDRRGVGKLVVAI